MTKETNYLPPFTAVKGNKKKDKEESAISDENYLKSRVVFMEEDFREKSCNKLKKQLLYLFTHNSKKPITIYISSYGGSVDELLMIYGLLKSAPCKIITVALGKCMSAGSYLLLLGDKRYIYPFTRLMFHELAWGGGYSKLHDKETYFNESKRCQEILSNIVKNTTKTKNVDNFLKEDSYMEPTEALKLGVVHKIL